MRALLADPRVRRLVSVTIGLALVAAIVVQRRTVAEAVGHLGNLSVGVVGGLIVLAVADRVLRAELIRSLLPELSLLRGEMISDIGAAASKGLPAGGPLGTVLRWQIAKEGGVDAVGFVTMLVAAGVATAFVGWTLPLVATVVDTVGRSTDALDVAIIAVSAVVLMASLAFWAVVLTSGRAEGWLATRSDWIIGRLARVAPSLSEADPHAVVTRLLAGLRRIAARPVPLLVRTAAIHLNGAVILWLALQGLGVGPDLGASEFARVFFVTHLVGSFAPTPGGVGLIEVGLSAALIAAGVDDGVAVAAVVIYRLITFVAPIVVGALLYVPWQRRRRGARRPAPAATP
ncbi:MAG: lysylphosphatidylglycerol synthase domain-containing protein [Actinomycetota bacterium]